MVRENEYFQRYKQLFAHYVDDETGEIIDLDFKKEVIAIRKNPDKSTQLVSINRLILKYKFPSVMQEFLKKFILEDKIDFEVITLNLFLVSPSHKQAVTGKDESLEMGMFQYVRYSFGRGRIEGYETYAKNGDLSKVRVSKELKLVIGKDVSIEQLIDFIRSNKQHIKEFQKQLRDYGEMPARVRPRKNLKRDMRVKELKTQGKSRKQIVEIVNDEFPKAVLAYGDVATILRNLDR